MPKAKTKVENEIEVDDEHAVVVEEPKEPAASEVKDVNGQAVVSVDVPARTVEVPLAFSLIEGCAIAAVQAWDAVKGEGDADFAHASGEFRQDLINRAESVYRTGRTLPIPGTPDGETAQARFEREVLRIKIEQGEAAAKAAKG